VSQRPNSVSTLIEDTLSLAVSGVMYFQSGGQPAPSEIVLRWHLAVHPCDGAPYVVGIDFP
jgi:hypothetical protein